MSTDNKKTSGERKKSLEELAAKRREANEEDNDKLRYFYSCFICFNTKPVEFFYLKSLSRLCAT
jgi:hypothetical protein